MFFDNPINNFIKECIMRKEKKGNELAFCVKSKSSVRDVFFNVVKDSDCLSQHYLETLLQNLNIFFKLGKINLEQKKPVNFCRYEPAKILDTNILNVDVFFDPSRFIVRIYPAKYDEVILQIEPYSNIINTNPGGPDIIKIINLIQPGNGQIVTSFFSLYKNLSINPPLSEKDFECCSESIKSGITFEIYSYHPVYQKEFKIPEPFFVGLEQVKNLLELIAGGREKKLTVEKMLYWKKLIFYAVKSMRFAYENQFVFDENNKTRLYFLDIWNKIENIEEGLVSSKEYPSLDEYLVECLEELRYKILYTILWN